MGITLANLQDNRRTVEITFDELSFKVTYRPGAITPSFGTEDRDSQTWLIDVLLRLIASWDIFEDDAQTVRVPVTVAALSSDAFGVPLLRTLYDSILDDALAPKVRQAS